MPTKPDYSWLQWLKIKLGLRDNEYDTGTPGPPRPMAGIKIIRDSQEDITIDLPGYPEK